MVQQFIRSNSRAPDKVIGDIDALVSVGRLQHDLTVVARFQGRCGEETDRRVDRLGTFVK